MKPFPGLSDVKRFLQDFRRDVIRMMRVKFIAMAMSILIAVFVVMLASINVIMNKVAGHSPCVCSVRSPTVTAMHPPRRYSRRGECPTCSLLPWRKKPITPLHQR